MVKKYGNDAKYKIGNAIKYINRASALKKLQLPLTEFRRICILKGIYPREPTKKKQAGRGSTAPKTYYLRNEIQRLVNEPIIDIFRQNKIYKRRLLRAEAKGNVEYVEHLKANPPSYSLDRSILERYPTFSEAIKDLSDCLNIVFLYATFPSEKNIEKKLIDKSLQLSNDFLKFIIAKKALRKVFVSIKGIYYEAEIALTRVVWVTPHRFAYKEPDNVDFRIMATFAEFYCALLGFVNFRLFNSVGVDYPLVSSDITINEECEDMEICEQDKKVEKQKILFEGLKFFIGREVQKDLMELIIRNCSGQVSWDGTVGEGASFGQSDESVTHEISDKSNIIKTHLNRVYIQPQWVFDSFNECRLLPTEDYFVGTKLPPHLSPFADPKKGEYVPPERTLLDYNLSSKNTSKEIIENPVNTTENDTAVSTNPDDDLNVPVKRKKPSSPCEEKRKLSEMLIPKRNRFLYKCVKEAESKRIERTNNLKTKRRAIDGKDN